MYKTIESFCKYAIFAFYKSINNFKSLDINNYSDTLVDTIVFKDLNDIDDFLRNENIYFHYNNFENMLETLILNNKLDEK